MYLGEAAGGMFAGLKARDEMDLNEAAISSKRLLLARQLKNQQTQNYFKLLESVRENPEAALEAVRGASAEDLADQHRAALLAMAHQAMPGWQAFKAKQEKLTGIGQGGGVYVKDARLYNEQNQNDQKLDALRKGLQLYKGKPTEFQQYLAVHGIQPKDLDTYASALFPGEMAELGSHKDFWKAVAERTGKATALDARAGAMPGRPAPVGAPSVGQAEAAQAGREARATSQGTVAGQYDHPLKQQLDQARLELMQAQKRLALAREGQLSREELFDDYKRLSTLATALRTIHDVQFAKQWTEQNPGEVIDQQTGKTLADSIEEMLNEYVTILGPQLKAGQTKSRSLPIPRQSSPADTVPALPPAPAQQVPGVTNRPPRPRILDIQRLPD